MARFSKFKSRAKRAYGGFRKRFSRRSPTRRRRTGGGKLLGFLPQHIRLGGLKLPFILIAAVAAYFFIAPVKAAVNKLIGKK